MNYALEIVSNLGESITKGLDNVYSTAVDYADMLSSTAQLICGFAALLYIGSKLWKSWAKGDPIDFYSMLRPFAIGLVIIFFTGFTKVLDSLVKPIEAATVFVKESATDKVQSSYSEYFEMQKKVREMQAKAEASKSEEKLSVWRTISKNIGEIKDNLMNSIGSLSDTIFKFLIDLGSITVDIFTMATVYFYKVYVVTAKIVLVLIGPFALALSVIPGFEKNFKAWVAQYINVSLYIPICNIIGFVQSMIVSECLYAPGTSSMNEILQQTTADATLATIDGNTMMIQICGMLLGIISIMLYSHVPTFANWILRGDGSGGLAAAFSVGGGLAATRIGNFGGNQQQSQQPAVNQQQAQQPVSNK